jgi:hypothetical protein
VPLILLLLVAAVLPAAQKNRQNESAPYAVVAGTVFRDPGFAIPGAEVILAPVPGTSAASKIKKQKEIANGRGEFAFRVPPGPIDYNITATAKGFNALEKKVTVYDQERVDVTFVLEPSSNK